MADINVNVPAIEKLLDYAASGVGAIAGPWLARRQARADADVMRIRAQGQADTISLIAAEQAKARESFEIVPTSVQAELDIGKEIQSRIAFQEEKRQSNIHSVVTKAAEVLSDKQVQDHEVDDDWSARFFADVQDVSSAQMQEIWAKILAGEVETPGRTSLRTLSILKNMTQRDAMLFGGISRFTLDNFVLDSKDITHETIPGFPTHDTLITFQSYGLITIGLGLARIIYLDDRGSGHFLDRDSIYRTSYQNMDDRRMDTIEVSAHILTPQGVELQSVVATDLDLKYLGMVARFLSAEKHCTLEQASVIFRSGSFTQHGPWRLIEAHVP